MKKVQIIKKQDHEFAVVFELLFLQGWNLEHLYAARTELSDTVNSVEKPCYILVNLLQTHILPRGFVRYFTNRPANERVWSSHVQMVVIVTQNPFVRMVSSLISQVYRGNSRNFHFVDTLDQAERIIDRHRALAH